MLQRRLDLSSTMRPTRPGAGPIRMREPRPAGSSRRVVRRQLAIGGVAQTVAQADQALAAHGIAAAVRAQMNPILVSWDNAAVVHDFAAPGLLMQALQNALAMPAAGVLVPGAPVPAAIPALFRVANLVFITETQGRLPTLYFTDAAGNTGRLRQQHPTGPLAKRDHTRRSGCRSTTWQTVQRCIKS